MNLRQSVLAVLLTGSAGLSWASASLHVPEHLQLISINGQETSGNLLSRARSYAVPAGDVVLELRYADVVDAEVGDSHSNYKSAPVGVRFKAADQESYAVSAERPATESAARAFAKAPRVTVVSVATQQAPEQQFIANAELKNGALTALAQAATPTAAPAPAAATAPAVPARAAVSTAEAGLVDQNLWYWWQQADDAAKRRFLQKIGR